MSRGCLMWHIFGKKNKQLMKSLNTGNIVFLTNVSPVYYKTVCIGPVPFQPDPALILSSLIIV